MKFRPCIDLHNGVVKQIVGSTLTENDAVNQPVENFVASKPASDFARFKHYPVNIQIAFFLHDVLASFLCE